MLLSATPASATGNAIDPGDRLYAINCDDVYNDWQLTSVESTTAVTVPIGNGSGGVSEDSACAYQAAYNPATGESFYIQYLYPEQIELAALARIDVTTGVSTTIGQFLWDNGESIEPVLIETLAIGADGSAYALGEGALWSVDLADASLEYIGGSLNNTFAFAYDAKSDQFYAIDLNNDIFIVDITDGSGDFVGSVVAERGVYSLQFDEAGTFWVSIDEESGAGLWSFTLPTSGTPVYSGRFAFYTESILIVPGAAPAPPAPVLPATGSEAPLLLGAIAGLVVVAGVGILVARRRTA